MAATNPNPDSRANLETAVENINRNVPEGVNFVLTELGDYLVIDVRNAREKGKGPDTPPRGPVKSILGELGETAHRPGRQPEDVLAVYRGDVPGNVAEDDDPATVTLFEENVTVGVRLYQVDPDRIPGVDLPPEADIAPVNEGALRDFVEIVSGGNAADRPGRSSGGST